MSDLAYHGKLLFPRLVLPAARKQLAENMRLELLELYAASDISHPGAAPAAVGGHPATPGHLEHVRASVRRLAAEYSFPSPLSSKNQASFDRACASLLLREMDIVVGDAAAAEVWSFMSLVLLPEIPFWRFPAAAEERYLGGNNRNSFHRLWWRALTFGPDLTSVSEGQTPFGEDDFVQVMERPTVSGNRRLAKVFYDVVLSTDLGRTGLTRSDLVRALVVQVRARRAHVAFDMLDDTQLRAFVAELRDSLVSLPK